MVITRCFNLLGCVLSLVLIAPKSAKSQPLPLEANIGQSLRDSSGTIWGVRSENSSYLNRWTDKGWQPDSFSPSSKAWVFVMTKDSKGDVMVLWDEPTDKVNSTNRNVVSLHRGTTSRIIGSVQYALPEMSSEVKRIGKPLGASGGQNDFIWFAYEGRTFYPLQVEGTTQRVLYLTDKMLKRNERTKIEGIDRSIPLLTSTNDGQGRIWIWDQSWPYTYSDRLRGLLTVEKGQSELTLHETLPGLPQSLQVHVMIDDGPNRLYIALRDHGLYEIDASTLQATKVDEPFRGAFGYVRQLWVEGGELYVVAGAPTIRELDNRRSNTLWRRRGGQWKRLIVGMDRAAGERLYKPRPFLKTPEGLWMSAYGDGLWFVGKDDQPKLVNWQQGFNILSVQNLLPLKNNAILATSEEGTSKVPSFAQISKQRPSPNVTALNPYVDLVLDKKLHVWTILNLKDHALHEWNGEQWKKHSAPANYNIGNAQEIAFDGDGRVWIFPDYREGQTAIFNCKNGAWQIYPTYQMALLANRKSKLPIANFRSRGPEAIPSLSSDGRLCYLGPTRKIYYFNGKNWQSYQTKDIEEKSRYPDFYQPPFFGKKEQFCVQTDNVYELTTTGWKVTKEENNQIQASNYSYYNYMDSTKVGYQPPYDELPNAPSNDGWDDKNIDSEGTLWFLKKQTLYRFPQAPVPFKLQQVLGENENQPFLRRYSNITYHLFIDQMFTDVRGNTFIKKGSEFAEWIMLRNNAPVPDTYVQLRSEKAGTFTAYLEAPGATKSDSWFSWRLNGKEWSRPTQKTKILVDSLKPGRHQFEVKAITAAGRPDLTPARAFWKIEVYTPEEIQHLIQQLGAPNFEQRELAIRALSNQSPYTLPYLRTAFITARRQKQEDVKWWLQAAIREAESKL